MDERTMMAEAEIGEQGKQFLGSDLGRTMLGLAAQELEDALDSFESADLTDTKKLMEIQNAVRFARRFPKWMNSLIADGEEAIAAFASSNRRD